MKRVKRVWSVILILSLVLGMIAPSLNTKAEGTQQNPVKSIEGIYHGIIVEGTQVAIDYWNVEYIFTFSDGSQESYSHYDMVYGQTIAPNLIPEDLLSDGSWDAGRHYWKGTTHGLEFYVEVDVLSLEQTPIQSISAVATKELVADWHWGSNDGGTTKFLQPNYCYPKVEIIYKNGSKETVYYDYLSELHQGVSPTLSMDTSLEGTGTRKATLEYYGHTCTFDVNVIENPVESVSAITTKPLIKGWRGVYSLILDGGLILTVNYKDGRKISGTPDELLYELYAYPNDFPDNTAVIGKNTKQMEFLGQYFDVDFEVIEDPNPVVGFDAKVKEGAVLYENMTTGSEIWYKYDHLIDVTLTFKDGSKLTGTIDEVNQKLENINIKEVYSFDEQGEQQWGIGEHSATVEYDSFEKNVSIKVVANPYKKATISNEDGMTVVLEKANGEKETYKASNFEAIGSMGSNSNMFGYLATDKGVLPVEINFGGGRRSDYTDISSMIIHGIKTNALKNCEWLEQQMMVAMYGNVPQVTVNNSAAELKEMVLCEADYVFGRADATSAKLEISEKTSVSEEEQKLLDNARANMANYEEGVVVDLTLYKQFQKTTQKVSEPNGTLSITMEVPEEILSSGTSPQSIKMVRIHEGSTQVLPCTYDEKTKTITFETNKFSTYCMVYEVVNNNTAIQTDSNVNEHKQDKPIVQTPSPKTGDSNSVVAYMALTIVALTVIIVDKKRKNLV